jgi:hypothetical protein
VLASLRDRRSAAEMARRGREQVVRHYSWDVNRARVRDAVSALRCRQPVRPYEEREAVTV